MGSGVAVALLATAAFAGPKLGPAAEQVVAYNDGKTLLLSHVGKTEAVLTVELAPEALPGPLLWLAMKNGSDIPVVLAPQSVVVTTDKGKAVPVLSTEILVEQARKKAKGQETWARIGAGFAAAGAGYGSSTTSFSGYQSGTSMFGTVGRTPFSAMTTGTSTFGTATTTTYDPAVAAAQTADIRAGLNGRLTDIHGSREQTEQLARLVGFRPDTVEAGAVHETMLSLGKLPRGTKALTVAVRLGEDEHQFELIVSQ